MEKLMDSLPIVPKQVVADSGYASEENYLFAIGKEKEPRFELLAPYNTYLKEQTRKYKKDISKIQNRIYLDEDDFLSVSKGWI